MFCYHVNSQGVPSAVCQELASLSGELSCLLLQPPGLCTVSLIAQPMAGLGAKPRSPRSCPSHLRPHLPLLTGLRVHLLVLALFLPPAVYTGSTWGVLGTGMLVQLVSEEAMGAQGRTWPSSVSPGSGSSW